MKQLIDEWKYIIRGKFILTMLIAPVIVCLVFGYIFQNNQLTTGPLAIVDLDNSSTSIQLINKLNSTEAIHVKNVYHHSVDPNKLLYNEKYLAVLYLPKGLEESRLSQTSVNVGFYIDTGQLGVSGNLRTAVSQVLTTENMQFGMGTMKALGLSDSQASATFSNLALQQRLLYNPTNNPLNGSALGFTNIVILALLTMSTIAIVPRLRLEGRLAQILNNPVGIIFRILPYAVVATISLFFSIGLLRQFGGIRFEVELIQIWIPFLLYTIAASLLAMLVGWTAPTPAKAGGRLLILILPSTLLGGIMLPALLLPKPLQWLSNGLPISWHFKFLRGMGLRGGDLKYFIQELGSLSLLICGFLSFILLLILKEKKSLKSGACV